MQGQHFMIIGQTQSGKTYAARDLLDLRAYCVSLINKRDKVVWWRWKEAKKARQVTSLQHDRWRLIPVEPHDNLDREDTYTQTTEFYDMMDRAYVQGSWTVHVNEMYYLENILGSQQNRRDTGVNVVTKCVQLITQGAIRDVTVVLETQRPSDIDHFYYSETSWVMAFRLGDERDIKTMGDMVNRRWASGLPDLQQHEFSIYHKPSGWSARGYARDLHRLIGPEDDT